MSVSQDLLWELLRHSHSKVVRRNRDGVRLFSTESGNLKNVHSYKYSGLANHKVVTIDESKSGKGISFSTRSEKAGTHQVKSGKRTSALRQSSGSRRIAAIVSSKVAGYRPDLRQDALARASAICKSQHNTKTARTRQQRSKRSKLAASATAPSSSTKRSKTSPGAGAAPAAAYDDDIDMPDLA